MSLSSYFASHLCNSKKFSLNFTFMCELQFKTCQLKDNRLTSWVITLTIITGIMARLPVIYYFCLILCYDDGHTVHRHLTCLPRRSINIFQPHIFWSFVFTTWKFAGRFWSTGAGKLYLRSSLLGTDKCWVQSRFSCWRT